MDATVTLAPLTPPVGFATAAKALNRLLRLSPDFACHNAASPQREALEAYVAEQFARTYEAQVSEFLPNLLSMQCQGKFSAVSGIRHATTGTLFVERYLDVPVERALGGLAGRRLPRHGIVEIGNLSATHRGATLLFFVIQAAILYEARYEWAIFAATDRVRKIVAKLGFATFDLGAADPARLGPEAARWGRYYETDPRVLAANVSATMVQLRNMALPAAVMSFFADTITDVAQSLRRHDFR